MFPRFRFNALPSYESDEDTDSAMIKWLAYQRVGASQLCAAFDLSMRSRNFVSYG